MKTKLTLGWIFVITGTIFLFCGLVVMIFATLVPGMEGPSGELPTNPSIWVSLANALMEFIIDLLEVEWTAIRVGVFLIMIGVIFDGSGAYMMISNEAKSKNSNRKTNKPRRKKN